MKLKTLMGVIAAGCIFSSAAFGQTLQIIGGTVNTATDSQITLRCETDTWTIKRTTTTVISGAPTPGSIVTVQCRSPDAQKKESPTTPVPTPSG